MSNEPTQPKVREESAGLMKYSAENLVPFGPIHPALKEPEYFKLVLEGEKIVQVIPRIGYVHRGLEKAAESRPWVQNMYMFEHYLRNLQLRSQPLLWPSRRRPDYL